VDDLTDFEFVMTYENYYFLNNKYGNASEIEKHFNVFRLLSSLKNPCVRNPLDTEFSSEIITI